eukprot:gene10700-10857_t
MELLADQASVILQEFGRTISNDGEPEPELASASSVLVVQQQQHQDDPESEEQVEAANAPLKQGHEEPPTSPSDPRKPAVAASSTPSTPAHPAQPAPESRVALQLRCQSLEVALEQQQQRTEALAAVLAAAHASHQDEEASIRQYYEVCTAATTQQQAHLSEDVLLLRRDLGQAEQLLRAYQAENAAAARRIKRLKVLRPLSEPATFCTTLWRPVKGVLFYGPPGTGKTMLAKALAAESNCFFINVTASAIMSKWYGDANRFIRAIFTLAAKLEPAVIFIDEVDAFLTKRGAQTEHEATLQAKTEFMQLWDGMEGARGSRVLVMGATNRPWMVDEAVLREVGYGKEQ